MIRLHEVHSYEKYKAWLAEYGYTREQAIRFVQANIQISVRTLISPESNAQDIARIKRELDWETRALKELEDENTNA